MSACSRGVLARKPCRLPKGEMSDRMLLLPGCLWPLGFLPSSSLLFRNGCLGFGDADPSIPSARPFIPVPLRGVTKRCHTPYFYFIEIPCEQIPCDKKPTHFTICALVLLYICGISKYLQGRRSLRWKAGVLNKVACGRRRGDHPVLDARPDGTQNITGYSHDMLQESRHLRSGVPVVKVDLSPGGERVLRSGRLASDVHSLPP